MASVIAAIVGYSLTRRRKGEEDDGPQSPPCRCEMVIYKEFGDTLMVGDAPQQVYAKIVRKTTQGDIDDPALTAMIRITSADGYLMLADGGICWHNSPGQRLSSRQLRMDVVPHPCHHHPHLAAVAVVVVQVRF